MQPKEQKDLTQIPVVNQVASSMVQVPTQVTENTNVNSEALYNEYVKIASNKMQMAKEEFMKASIAEQQTIIEQRKKC